MIRNIYKSYITTIAGILFLVGDVFYFTMKQPEFKIVIAIAVIGIILLFINDKYAKKIIDKIINVKI